MAPKCKKSQIWPFQPWKINFRAIQPNLSFDMWFMSSQRSSMPKTKKKLLKRFLDWPLPHSWRRTDRRTTDKSALEKLRCLSAGRAKKWDLFDIQSLYCSTFQSEQAALYIKYKSIISQGFDYILGCIAYFHTTCIYIHIWYAYQ